MPSSSFSVFDNAEPLELSAVNSFSLRDPDRVWFVQEGAIDIFLQDISEGTLEGPRHYLTRITAGQAVFGFAAASEFRVAIVASPAPDTRVLRMSMEQLRSGLAEDPPEPRLLAMVNQWIINLAQLASDSTAPKRFTEIRAGEQVPPGEGNRIIAPRDGVLWVRHAAGQSSFLGKKTVPASEDTFFPVSKSGWLEAPPDTQPEIVATEYIAFADPDWRGLQLFQKLILECIVAKRKQAEEGEQQRLRAKADATGSMVHGALCWLASALDKSRENPPEQEERGSPLLRACRRVGRVLGLDIVPPPDLDSNRYKDPVFGIARASSVRARKVMLRENWWREDGGPLVAFRAHDDRPVALVPTSGARYNVYDPVDGTTNRVTAKVAATLSATAYCFYRPFPDKLMTLKDLMLFGAANCRRDIVTVLLMGLGGGILSLLGPIAVAILFDYAIPGAQREDVRAIAIFLLVSSSSTALFSVTRSFSVLRMQGKLDAVLQAAAWDRLLRLPAPFFRQYNSGDLAIRSMAFKEIGQALSGPFLSLVITQLFSLLSIVLLFVYSWQLALIAMALVLTAMGVSAICLRINLKHSRELSKIRGRIAGIVLELVNGVPKFRVSGAEAKAFSVWARVAGDRRRTVRKARYSAIALWVFNASWPVFCSGVLFYFAADLVNAPGTSTLSTGRFLAFFSVFNQVVHSALWFAVSLMPVLGIVPLYERAKPILDATPEARKATAHPGELTGAIEVSGLNFRYTPDGPLVLRDMSFSIEPGSMVAIVGSSGCGKSTLFRLLLGFEKPESGGIFFDGQDLAGLDVQAVRQQMGVVLQNAKLGSGSLVNLIIGSAPLTIDDAWEAARMTGLEKDIASMPMGMHTAISDGAGTLSGGQRQRLTIARAIVNRPRIILFDEATSALDNETQAVVTRSLEKLRATRIVIAHRLSTITNADRILVLDSGNVVQSGRYEELMAQPGPFRELASRQIA